MSKIPKVLFLCSFLVCMIAGCKSRSYGSSQLHQNSYLELSEKDQNCLAWRFYLMIGLDSMVKQATLHYKTRKRNEEYRGSSGKLPPITETIVEKILPAKKVNEIIDTIIEKEGGVCSRELLYETPCVLHSERGGSSSKLGLGGSVKYEYFSSILGITLTPDSLDEFSDFLKDHIVKSPNTEASFDGFYCMMNTCPKKNYEAGNVFGLCIIKKHKKYLKDHNLFDLNYYNYFEKYGWIKEDKESLEAFIKRSNEIAAENKSKKEKKN